MRAPVVRTAVNSRDARRSLPVCSLRVVVVRPSRKRQRQANAHADSADYADNSNDNGDFDDHPTLTSARGRPT